jgi:hypothetical protein
MTFVDDAYQLNGKTANQCMTDLEANCIELKKNFAGNTFPSNPLNGQMFAHIYTENEVNYAILKIFYGGSWHSVYDFKNELLLFSPNITTDDLDEDIIELQHMSNNSVDTAQILDDAVTTEKIKDGEITAQKLENYVAGSYLLTPYGTGLSTGTSYAQKIKFRVGRSGTIRVRIGLKASNGTAYANIRKNGIDTSIEETSTSTSSYTFSINDISVVADDTIEIFLKASNVLYTAYAIAALACSSPIDSGLQYTDNDTY